MSGSDSSSVVLIPSGSFISNPDPNALTPLVGSVPQSSLSPITLFNPMRHPKLDPSFEVRPPTDAEIRAAVLDKSQEIDARALADYGERIVEIAMAIAREQPHFIVAPLRGARKPTTLLQVTNQLEKELDLVELSYTGGSSGRHDTAIISQVTEILARQTLRAQSDTLRIAVVDAADGGQGSYHLATILAGCQAATRQNLVVDFHLLHTRTAPGVGRMNSIMGLSRDGLTLRVQRHVVEDLIVEDYDERLGLSSAGDLIVQPCLRPGVLLVRDGERLYMCESKNLSQTIDEMLAKWTSDVIETHPEFKLEDPDFWQNFNK